MEPRQVLAAWLNDAYAMEKALVPILRNHAKDAKDHPELRERIERHVQETEHHAEVVRGCLEMLGEQPSGLKAAAGAVFGTLQAPMTGMAGDELVKNNLADYATEHFEIACYRALVAAAQEMGEAVVAQRCAAVLREEEEMAAWLEAHLAQSVREHLHHVGV